MINEIQPKIKFQNIVQCPFNEKLLTLAMASENDSNEYKPLSVLWF